MAANETENEDENKNDDDSNTEDGMTLVKRIRKNKSIDSEYSDSQLDDDSPANTARKILFMMNKNSSNPQELEIIGGKMVFF